MPHDVEGIGCAVVVASRELGDVAVKVLLAEVMKGALISPREDGPEAVDPVGVGLPPHILSGTVIDRLMLEGHPLIGTRFVGEHLRARRGVLADEALERRAVVVLDRTGRDLVGLAILGLDGDGFPDRSPPRQRRPFAFGMFFRLAPM